MLYKLKTVKGKAASLKEQKASEAMLRDLLKVLPVLKHHKMDGVVSEKVRTVREGRKTRQYTLELSRDYDYATFDEATGKWSKGKKLMVSSPITKESNRMKILRELKGQIRQQIQEIRKASLPPIEEYEFRQGVKVKKLAEVYLEHGVFLKVQERNIRLNMGKDKKPKTNDKYVGVEIELASKLNRQQICDILYGAGFGKYLCVKDDGSIGSARAEGGGRTKLLETHPYGHELVVLVKEVEYVDVLTRLCKLLNEECSVKVDKTCGLHVHLDMRGRPVETAFHNLVSMQHYLYGMLPAARRNSTYSYPIKGTQWRIPDDRYHGINAQAFTKHKTLEARMHCGTTQGDKIVNWVQLLIAIADAPKITAVPKSMQGLQAVTGISDDLVKYVSSRVAKFKSQFKDNPPTREQPNTMPDLEELTVAPAADPTVTEDSEVA